MPLMPNLVEDGTDVEDGVDDASGGDDDEWGQADDAPIAPVHGGMTKGEVSTLTKHPK